MCPVESFSFGSYIYKHHESEKYRRQRNAAGTQRVQFFFARKRNLTSLENEIGCSTHFLSKIFLTDFKISPHQCTIGPRQARLEVRSTIGPRQAKLEVRSTIGPRQPRVEDEV